MAAPTLVANKTSGSARAYVTLDELLRLRHSAKGFSFLPRQPVHSLLTGRHASRLRGRGLDFEELRHYYEGDDTRTIDWAATARLGSPHVRVFTEERDRSVLLLVDQRLSMFFGSKLMMKSVAAAEAAALSAWRVTSLGDRIGAIVYSEDRITELQPEAREKGVLPILHEVARQNAALKATDERAADPGLFNEALRRAARLVHHDGLVCVISDAYGADAETVKLVTKITAHNDVLAIFVSDPIEAELPALGRVIVGEGDNQIEVDSGSTALRGRFAQSFSERRDSLESFSRKRTIPVLPIETGRDVSAQLRDLLGQRLAHARTGARAAS
ncbi:hypothetical protein K32_12870 [Kaistia sp. 32K]|uniref:DUF58 domain-containing protein n=1 Tax=Kaistia sp. 32K TaxID=2795690 RepID=UPI001915DEE9|nr:DUF58 domain-containing protein [Kaistia sp. 32K]BCP52670.1 hypothetical protein K32_12870 [Kaistia sp. 32K]